SPRPEIRLPLLNAALPAPPVTRMISASIPSSLRKPLLCAKAKVMNCPLKFAILILTLSAASAEAWRRKTVSEPTRSFSIGLSPLIPLVKIIDETAFVQLLDEAHIGKVFRLRGLCFWVGLSE